MTEYGRIHTDGSRSGGQPVLLPCPFCGGEAEVERSGTNRRSHIIACTDCGCRLETGETWNAGSAWNTRQPTQSDAVQAEIEALRHDLERQMTIANEQVNEVERLREALAHIAFSGADGPYGEFGEALNEHQMRRVAKAALQEQSK